MEDYFQKIINFDQNVLVLSLLVIFFTLEQLINSKINFKQSALHLVHNLLLQIGYTLVNFGFAFVMIACFTWITKYQIGLFNQIPISYPFKVLVGLLCIDFTYYWSHRLYHVSPLFWRFHRVHHSDIQMAADTSFRFHPFDAFLDGASSITAAVIFGLDVNIILFFFVIYLPILFAQHSKFIFPDWTDKILGKIIMSPNLHKVHHHQKQEYTDANYGNIFVFWDKLFGTFKILPVDEIKYGLEEFDEPKKQTAWFLIKSPFLNIKRIK
jgi:sterol desaturase/sphingolipid hydroxylase (fatty acid hydroxylase superfamily)